MAIHRGGNRQRGAILVVGLIVLLLMTLLGLSIMGGNAVEEKMAGNERDRQIAFQAAEAALREGERLIVQTNSWQTRVNDNCTNGFCKSKKLDA
ncbi:MAG TPA: PilX N-terminal domain-containing pilus assembly protein, partial [Pseudomonadales bacterium]|nr:PilX N-terminal domain-containing pilus assembly protein [Pseudomonadales bacterium]